MVGSLETDESTAIECSRGCGEVTTADTTSRGMVDRPAYGRFEVVELWETVEVSERNVEPFGRATLVAEVVVVVANDETES